MKSLTRYGLGKTPYVVILLFLAQVGYSQGIVPDSIERQTLQEIYDSTRGDQWSEFARWTQGQIESYPDSALYGIEISNGDITSINLNSIGLDGSLPPSINDLKGLQYLSLFSNSLRGSIPVLDNLTNLITLNLSNNSFTGSFPASIGLLVKLQILNLQSSFLRPEKLTGPIPASYGNLTDLRSLDLSYNDLGMPNAFPDTLRALDKLQSLLLVQCSLRPTSFENGIKELNALQTLYLSNNPSLRQTDGVFPDMLIDLPLLRNLFLENINFAQLPATFDGLSSLTYLSLAQNNYSDLAILQNIVDTLQYNPSLATLNLRYCQLPGLPGNFNQLSNLQYLFMGNNPNLQAANWEIIGQMPLLRELYVESSDLFELPLDLVNVTTLEKLVLTSNRLFPIPEHIKNIPNLRHLNLANNGIGQLPAWFGSASMVSIQELFLQNNSIPLPLSANFNQLVNLQRLDLSFNNLAGPPPSYFSTFSSLRYLNLSHNELQLPIPDFSSWTFLQDLYLQNNSFEGTLPSYFGQMGMVSRNLNISFNDFDSIPIFDPSSTLNLNVSHNQLTFADIVPRPALNRHYYSPQDSIDTERQYQAFVGGSVSFVARVDTATNPRSTYQWFQYVPGGADIPMTSPILNGYVFTLPNLVQQYDSTEFYYKITNSNAPGLALSSRKILLIVRCGIFPDTVNFGSKRYLCAMKFDPVFEIADPCVSTEYIWDFGDGNTSRDRVAWHAYGSPGTYDVSLKVNYSCSDCIGDTTITRSVPFALPDQLIRDTLLQVSTDVRQQILQASAATFSDSWPLTSSNVNLPAHNAYTNGNLGIWRNDGAYVYDTLRKASAGVDIAKDGTFTLEHFNWPMAAIGALPQWINTGNITRYNPYSFEVENRDILGIYSAALYDYGGHLVSANGVNTRYDEMAYSGFEFLEQGVSGNWVLGNDEISTYSHYAVTAALGHLAVVAVRPAVLEFVERADVTSRNLFYGLPGHPKYTNYVPANEIICIESHPSDPELSLVVFREAPHTGLWSGRMRVRNNYSPATAASLDNTLAHTGKSSLRVSSRVNFRQPLLQLDSGKVYRISAWASVNDDHLAAQRLADGLGIHINFTNPRGEQVATSFLQPAGRIINGWQRITGSFTCPINKALLSIDFDAGSTVTAWFDDLRLHPEKSNMRSYVYNLDDYRLQAVLDEENYGSLFYYDAEGNLYLTKKETIEGIKTISENISYMIER